MPATPEQQEAIDCSDENSLVVACPGSGKTFVLIQKSIKILEDEENVICMVTFTRASAEEMRARALRDFGETDRLFSSTFDSLAYSMLREVDPSITPPDEVSLQVLIKNMFYVIMGMEKTGAELLDELERHGLEMSPKGLKEYLDKCNGNYFCPFTEQHEQNQFLQMYLEECKKHQFYDFNQISRVVTSKLFSGDIEPPYFTHMMVDEFQDTSDVQMKLVEFFVEEGVVVTAVGDDDQSIYSFRQSLGYKGMMHYMDFADAHLVQLNACFRCPEKVIEHSKKLIEVNLERVEKPIESQVTTHFGQVTSHLHGNQDEEATFIADHIENADGTTAVLSRLNASLDSLMRELLHRDIKFKTKGIKGKWEKPNGRTALAILTLLNKPNHKTSGMLLFDFFSSVGQLTFKSKNVIDLYEIFDHEIVTKGIQNIHSLGSSEPIAEYLMGIFEFYREKDQKKVLEEFMSFLEDEGEGLIAEGVASGEKSKEFSGFNCMAVAKLIKEAMTIDDNIEKVVKRINFLSQMNKQDDEAHTVFLVSMHASKGLEFDNVHIINSAEGVSPSWKGDEAEERRLYYVAMTRSQNNLLLHFPQYVRTNTGDTVEQGLSRFIEECGMSEALTAS